MMKMALCLVGLLLAAIAAACGDGDGAPSEPQEDAASILRQAHTAMRGLDSFRAVMTVEAEGDRFDFTLEWQRPDSFHMVAPWEQQRDGAVEVKGVSEAIAIGDRSYGRQCNAEGEDCSEWTEAERGDIYLPAPSPGFDPHWPILGLDLVVESRIVGSDQIDDVSSTHIEGKLNGLRAVYQTLEEGLRQRGATTYGRECTARPGQPEECRDVPIEEFMEKLADDIRRGDENPAPVDIWIGRDDKLLRRLDIGSSPADVGQPTTLFTYSRFNQVEIRPPK